MDPKGHQILVLEDISYHQINGTYIAVDDGFIINQGRKKYWKKTTRGSELLTQINKGFLQFVPMKDINESNPVELAEYAV